MKNLFTKIASVALALCVVASPVMESIAAPNNNEETDASQFFKQLNSETDPYTFYKNYQDKESLLGSMNTDEVTSFSNVLKYISLEHISLSENQSEETEKVVESYAKFRNDYMDVVENIDQEEPGFELISEHAKTLSFVKEENIIDVKNFNEYTEFLKSKAEFNVAEGLQLMHKIDSSVNEDEIKEAVEKLKQTLMTKQIDEQNYIKDTNRYYDEIISEYLTDNKNEDYMIEHRKKLVEENNLQDFVNDEYFFHHNKLDEIEGVYSPDSKYRILLNLTSENEILQLDKKIYSSSQRTLYDLSSQKVSGPVYNNNGNTVSVSTGGYYYYGPLFTISNCPGTSLPGGNNHTVYGYCARKNPNGNYDEAPNGASITNLKRHPNDSIFAKALYYGTDTGYNYAASRVSGWSGAGSSGRKMVVGNTTSWALGHDHYAKYLFKEYYDFCRNAPAAPEGFEAYEAEMNHGRNQTVSFGYFVPSQNGSAQLKKSSANPDLTNGNACYSLQGAEYGIYTDQKCTKKVASFTTDANGNSNKVKLKVGEYFVKETKAPKGYALDHRAYKIKVVPNQTSELKVTDVPTMDPVGILLGKIDKETNQNKPQGSASLENAHFEVKYYKGLWQKDVDPATLGKSPARTWVFKTNKNGYTRYSPNYLVSGSELYYSPNGTPNLPVGTITIQEKKAPDGYKVNPEVYVRQITDDEKNTEAVHTYNEPIIPEELLNLYVTKTVKGKDIRIPGVVFTHICPDGTKEDVTTDSNGEVVIKGLTRGSHSIIEKSVPEGFVRNPGEVKFHVTEDSKIVFDSTTATDQTGSMNFHLDTDGTAYLDVEDVYAPFSLDLHKQNEKGKKLFGAEFTLYSDKECKNILQKNKTGLSGKLTFDNLEVGETYYIKETKAPKGYKIPLNKDGSDIVFEIKTESDPLNKTFKYYVNGELQKDEFVTGNVQERIVNLTVINDAGLKLPDTGTHTGLIMSVIGLGLMGAALIFAKKKK